MNPLTRIKEERKKYRARQQARREYLKKEVESVSHLPPAEALEQIRPRTCSHCGKTEGFGKRIHLHHYASYDGDNATRTVLLCPSCHYKVHHVKP